MTDRTYRAFIAVLLLMGHMQLSYAQPTIKIASNIWSELTEQERSSLAEKYLVQKISSDAFGKIIDAQGVDKSTPGTTGGSQLGGAVANAAYVDRWLGGGSYSAKTQLAAILLGSAIGSSLDTPPVNRYHFRYAVRLGNGNVIYSDAISNEPFRHPPGICVTVPLIVPSDDQSLCDQTIDTVRRRFGGLHGGSDEARAPQAKLNDNKYAASEKEESNEHLSTNALNENVMCKVPSLSPIKTTKTKCLAIEGVIINDR